MNGFRIHEKDTVAVALSDLPAGAGLPEFGVETVEPIPAGHKVALREIPKGDIVTKYGFPIGTAVTEIHPGEWVHTHNLRTGLNGFSDYRYEPDAVPPVPRVPGSFKGFRRTGGRAGIRNEIWILPTVGCVNSIARNVEREARGLLRGSVGGVYAFPHPYGCSQLGEDHENTKKALCGLIRHPNAGGILVLGLGCENNQIAGLRELLGPVDDRRVKFLTAQDCADEQQEALRLVEQLIQTAAGDQREPIPMPELVVGLKCGGSDGFSGITANPLVGAFTNRLTAEGGSAILTEVPEMFGAETLLMNRCADSAVFEKTVRLINGFKDYFLSHGQEIYENPSPGNRAGGITTLEEKSLGCTQKSGAAPVTDVLDYGEPLARKGLNLLRGPGNDLVASSAEAISGAQIILFTTGRGTPFGAPVPTVKISSNTALSQAKRNWIDFDAGRLLQGIPLPELAEELYKKVRAIASGETAARTEQLGFRDLAIFKDGVTL